MARLTPMLGVSVLLGASLVLGACPRHAAPLRPIPPGALAAPCPAEAPAPPWLPDETAQHALPEFWLTRTVAPEELVTRERIEEHNRRMSELFEQGWPVGRWRIEELRLDPERVRARLRDRLERLREGAQRGERVLEDGTRPTALLEELRGELQGLRAADEVRVAHRSTAVRCFPTARGVYEKAWDLAFDLMQCSALRYGEPVRVAGKGSRYWYVWSTHSDGWVLPEDLTPALSAAEAKAYLDPPRFAVAQEDHLAVWADQERRVLLGAAPFGVRLPLLTDEGSRLEVRVPAPSGLVTGWVLAGLEEPAPAAPGAPGTRHRPSVSVSVGYPRLTRAALLDRAFRLLHTPYGWGGTGDKRDCSELMMDLFAAFGLQIPRNTKHQAMAGTRRLEVASLSESQKAEVIEAEARRGVVLLYMPGHIMLYLGRDGGRLYAFHLFSGYLTPCSPSGETMQRVNRAVVTSLELGRGGSRRAFIQRITRLVVFDEAASQ